MEPTTPREGGPAIAARGWRALVPRLRGSTAGRVLSAYGSTNTGSHASGLAFNAVMAMFPMILGALAIIGWVVNGPGIQSQVQTAILRALPGTSGLELSKVVTGDLHHYAGLLGIVGILGLLWGVTNFFGSLEFCLSRIFEFRQRSFLRQRAMGAVMMFVLVAGMLIAVAANTLMNLIPVMAGIGPAAGFLAMGALTLTIYRLVPNRTFRIRQLWPGAVVSGVLIELITLLFPLYAKLAHGFDTYGQSLALFFLLATWLAFLSQFLLIGALWNRVRLGEEFTASGLLATRGGDARSRATQSAGASPAAASGDDAVAGHATPAVDDSITGDVDTTTNSPPERSRRAKTTRA
ncbi:MAG: YihY/virulence factor BrkB family protein [Candidatus Dormibacteria bacterium]|jgi:membrane protein